MEFALTEEYIELVRLLKTTRIAESGGQAKLMVANGDVWRKTLSLLLYFKSHTMALKRSLYVRP